MSDAVPAAGAGPILDATDLHKRFTEGSGASRLDVAVLQGVDLAVQRGETVAIVGASGSGKSTLLHLLGGLEAPTPGPGRARRARLRRRWARPSRASGAIATSASSTSSITCCPSSPRSTTSRCRCACAASRSARRASGRPRCWRRSASPRAPGTGPAQLSGGERQRVAIARALAGSPECVLADEPTGNLDRGTADSVFALMLDLARSQSMALVLVTHDETLAQRCDRLLHLTQGRLAR